MRLKEDWLRLNDRVFGHRFMMDRIVPGGVEAAMDASQAEAMVAPGARGRGEVLALRGVFDDHAGLQDRFITTGRVTPELARKLGLAGLAGRASAQPYDLRVDFPCEPYGELEVKKVVYNRGDVAARVHARFDELIESLRLVRAILLKAPEARRGGIAAGARGRVRRRLGRGLARRGLRGARGGRGNRIRRGHAHDPSWQSWPLIEHAVIGNIVPDFPLINKSFNLSYSGHDS
jgi:Ni,Fe-hydrogenase III large subunit